MLNNRVSPFAWRWILLVGFVVSPQLVCANTPSGKYESFRVRTAQPPQANIEGWFLPADEPKGTLIVLHGYNNSRNWSLNLQWVRDREGWNVVMIDFRNHGTSQRMGSPSTLGYYEIDDVQATVDWAEKRNLARPFVIYGRSMGGATGMRFAGRDKRIEGVLAVSPFKNAELATRQMADYALRQVAADKPGQSKLTGGMRSLVSRLANGAVETYLDRNNPLPSETRRMLMEVDVPTAVAARDDLRLWIMSGEGDSFPPDDQRSILEASPSPPALKRLVITPGTNHRNTWAFAGDEVRDIPGHNQFVRDFLKASLKTPPARAPYPAASRNAGLTPMVAAYAIGGAMLLALIMLILFLRRARGERAIAQGLPPSTRD